jgi:hypothetical protein
MISDLASPLLVQVKSQFRHLACNGQVCQVEGWYLSLSTLLRGTPFLSLPLFLCLNAPHFGYFGMHFSEGKLAVTDWVIVHKHAFV